MSKAFIDQLIRNMKLAGIVSKVTPWMVEGADDRREEPARESAKHSRQGWAKERDKGADKQVNVRFVGLILKDDWLEVFSQRDNILLKFLTDRNNSYVEFYIANATPFTKIITREFTDGDKWEILLGEVKRRLKRDKAEFINHTDKAGNIYARIKNSLK